MLLLCSCRFTVIISFQLVKTNSTENKRAKQYWCKQILNSKVHQSLSHVQQQHNKNELYEQLIICMQCMQVSPLNEQLHGSWLFLLSTVCPVISICRLYIHNIFQPVTVANIMFQWHGGYIERTALKHCT